MPGRLLVCPTPIGNLEDVTLRVLDTLRRADVVACEDTRRTRVLLDRHGIRAAALVSYHEHNERSRAAELVQRVRSGDVVALVSDAGMPGVSDPGFVVVGACLDAGLPVSVLPGASSVTAAVVASGLPAERWTFLGFLPRRAGELARVWEREETLVAFESPRRLAATLRSLAAVDAGRSVAVCRELTKLHEEVVRGTAAELAARYAAEEPRGEIVVVVAPAAAGAADLEAGVAAVEALVAAGARARPAAAVVARLTGASANELYRRVAASSALRGRCGE
jgi:16S rRNA (cytidine1402-2'-O)-methyltransferase